MLVAAFERQTAIKVDLRSGDEATLGNQLVQEGQNSPADVFYSENTPVLEVLREKRLLAPVAAGALAQVPARYSSPQGAWVGVSARVSALVYNTGKLAASQLPGSILELADPRFAGKVGFAPSETDFQPLVTSIVKLHGTAAAERWLKGLQANGTVYPDNETVVNQVNNGQSALGPINQLLLVPPARRERQRRHTLGAALLRRRRRRRPRQHLRRGGARVELAQERRAGVPRVPRRPHRPAADRAQPQLRVPPAPRRQPGSGAGGRWRQ